ncbi:2'-5' RNA ligase family protein [Streptacidiphilus monticola]|uniref:2'-5' RNA ligase family protein n=1 Tax=Streptacidiphilus monticola TaxID=2161674 RepID=A0ABW1FWU9_9ACTN
MGGPIPAVGDPEDRMVIGVSVAVPEPFAAQVQDARAGYGDPLARSIPTHVTLLPPTELSAAELPKVERHLTEAAEAHRPFRVLLRGTDSFRPVSAVVFLRIEEGVHQIKALEADVRSGPLARELAFPYHPHVTVAHNLEPAVLDRAQHELRRYRAEFTVPGFSLYRFGADEVWRPLRAFPFPV